MSNTENKKLVPPILKKGDTIGVIAPSDPILKEDLEAINNSIALMEKSGFKIELGKNIFSNKLGYGATAQEKAEDINYMFSNKEIKAIFCTSGGYNSNIAFDYINYENIKKNPKIICGFSDSHSILNAISSETGLITFYGPTFKSLTSWDTDYGYKEVMKRFVDASLQIGTSEDEYITIQEGKVEGELIGGNLSLINNMVSGKYKINFENKILFFEDLGYESAPGMISNYLYNMKQNQAFEKIIGLWIGSYEHESNISLEQIVRDTIGNEYNFPIIKSNNFGHIDKKTVIPIGGLARIDTNKKCKIELIENCVK